MARLQKATGRLTVLSQKYYVPVVYGRRRRDFHTSTQRSGGGDVVGTPRLRVTL